MKNTFVQDEKEKGTGFRLRIDHLVQKDDAVVGTVFFYFGVHSFALLREYGMRFSGCSQTHLFR